MDHRSCTDRKLVTSESEGAVLLEAGGPRALVLLVPSVEQKQAAK